MRPRARAALVLLALSIAAAWGCRYDEPRPVTAPDPIRFGALARNGECCDERNRLFLIDGARVLWDRAGDCPDNAYAQTLFGVTPDQVLCRNHDSIAGPQKDCLDPTASPMFDIILAHLDQPDLGLGPGHTVRPIPF